MLKFNDVLFHGLRGHNITNVEKASLLRLSKIILGKNIFSREKQIECFGISFDTYSMYQRENPKFDAKEITNYNGKNYISICSYDKDTPMGENPYYMYVETGISIVLNKELLSLLEQRNNCGLPSEYQIKDMIPNDFFLGIALPHINIDSIAKWFEKGETRDSIFKELQGDFKIVSKINEILNFNGYHLPLYNISNGEEILSIEETREKIYQMIRK